MVVGSSIQMLHGSSMTCLVFARNVLRRVSRGKITAETLSSPFKEGSPTMHSLMRAPGRRFSGHTKHGGPITIVSIILPIARDKTGGRALRRVARGTGCTYPQNLLAAGYVGLLGSNTASN